MYTILYTGYIVPTCCIVAPGLERFQGAQRRDIQHEAIGLCTGITVRGLLGCRLDTRRSHGCCESEEHVVNNQGSRYVQPPVALYLVNVLPLIDVRIHGSEGTGVVNY